VVWFFPSNEDFQADNPFWNGTADISSAHPVLPLQSLFDLPSFSQGTTLIVIPYLDFTPNELERLYRFVTEGGMLVLADDYGFGNRVLEYLGLGARFSGQSLLDPLFCYESKSLPRIFHIVSSPITSGADSLLLNHATALLGVESGDVIALSSSFSFLDLNEDGSQDEGEPNGLLPVLSRHSLGHGQIILVADPSIFINSMQTLEGNHTLIENLTSISTSLFIDQSHLSSSRLHEAKDLLASVRDRLRTPLGAVGLVVVALAITLIPVWYKGGQ